MKKIMFGNSLMLLGIAIMILAGLKVIYVGTLWVSDTNPSCKYHYSNTQ